MQESTSGQFSASAPQFFYMFKLKDEWMDETKETNLQDYARAKEKANTEGFLVKDFLRAKANLDKEMDEIAKFMTGDKWPAEAVANREAAFGENIFLKKDDFTWEATNKPSVPVHLL